MGKSCCFIGHRKIVISEVLKFNLKKIITDLIEDGVNIFLFGSRSDFNTLCHSIITELKQTAYPEIVRKSYTCRHETCTLESRRKYLEEVFSFVEKRNVSLLGVEEEVEHKTKYTSARGNYVERNQAMIDDSDVCVFYYNENYLPPRRYHSKRNLCDYQPNSGTSIAYNYAEKKKKKIINVFI